jgi:lysophospholipase L1-like esterase
MSESNNNVPMRITQLEEATAYEDGMYYAVAKAGGGTKKISTDAIQPSLAPLIKIDYELENTGFVNYDNGQIVASSQYNYTKPIQLKKGVEYTLKSVNYTSVAAFSLCDENGNNITPVVKGQYDGEGIYTTVAYTPSNDCYVILSFNNAKVAILTAIERLDKMISELKNHDASINVLNDTLTANAEKTFSKNAFNSLTSQKGYLSTDGVTLIQYSDWWSTDFIDVRNFANVFTSCFHNNTQEALTMYFCCIYDENKDFIARFDAQQNPYTIIDSVKYLRFSYHKDSDINIQVENNTAFTEYEAFKEYYIIGANSWRDKKWTCLGDSLTEHNLRTKLNYHDYIAQTTGINVTNLGKSGSGYMSNAGYRFYERVSLVPTDSDVVTIFGSGNDLSFTLGEPTDTGTSTICGAINITIDNLVARMPRVSLGIVAPTPWEPYPPTLTNNAMALYVNALKTICENRSIPFLDLYHESNLRPWTAEGRAACYSKDNGGGTHPDEYGHKLIAPRFKAFLEELLI